ncbi:MAG: dihydrolipoyl dehydrogenase [Syntrophobacteraceae bacterium]
MKPRIVIVGGGPGGYAAAMRGARLGADVTLIERDTVGGVCLNRGCIPTKTMIHATRLLKQARRAHEFGLEVGGPVRIDLQRLMARKEKIVQAQVSGMLGFLQQRGVRFVTGRASLEGNRLVVRQGGGQVTPVDWDRLILATGAESRELPALPFDGRRVLSTDEALQITELPESILIVGGGVIGCEFAFLFNGMGTRVVVVEALPRVLSVPWVDEECAKVLHQEMKKLKIALHTNRTVETVEDREGKLRVTLGSPIVSAGVREKDRGPVVEEVDKVLVCVGRKPTCGDMGLDEGGIRRDGDGWIQVNDRMETTAPGVYAVGDVLGPSRMMLAHAASAEGVVAVENALGIDGVMDYGAVPSVVFTVPELSSVGLTEGQAKERADCEVQCHKALFRNVGKSHILDEIAGMAKIVSDGTTGKILGVHLVGAHAAELIAEGALAVRVGCTVKDLAQSVHAHPTLSEVISEALDSR